ncbi:MAG: hypothetical protein FJ104_06225, partial [Deltaproteobacteria bacterium]|nr:hypothetical protein [Deltaproteobacteria bacterium]
PTKAAEVESSPSHGSEEERSLVLGVVFADPELLRVIRLGEPGRLPLPVRGELVPEGVLAGGVPIRRVTDAGGTGPVLEVREIEIGPQRATVSFRFDAEGIKGTTTLSKGERGWEIHRSRIVEHFRKDANGAAR